MTRFTLKLMVNFSCSRPKIQEMPPALHGIVMQHYMISAHDTANIRLASVPPGSGTTCDQTGGRALKIIGTKSKEYDSSNLIITGMLCPFTNNFSK